MSKGVIIERRKDGTYWRHEMSADHFFWVTRMITFPFRFRITRAIELLDKEWHCGVNKFSDGITSRQVTLDPTPKGIEPDVIFVDEIAEPHGDIDPAFVAKPVPFENVPLMQFSKKSVDAFKKQFPVCKYVGPDQ